MLLEELQQLAANPLSWSIVFVLAGLSAYALMLLTRCPYVMNTAIVSETEVSLAQNAPMRPGTRFVVWMLAGIALTIAGLYMINFGIQPTLALGALVAGVVMIQTVPSYYHIRENRHRVVAGMNAPDDLRAGMRDRLRSSYRELATTNIVLLLAVTGALLVF